MFDNLFILLPQTLRMLCVLDLRILYYPKHFTTL